MQIKEKLKLLCVLEVNKSWIKALLRKEYKELNLLIEKVQAKTWLAEFSVAGPTWSVSAVNTGAVWLQRTRGWYQHAMLI